MYAVGKTYNIVELLQFCAVELQGIHSGNDVDQGKFSYRIQQVFISSLDISISPYFSGPASLVKEEFKKTEGIDEYNILFTQPITKIEELHKGFKESDKSIAVLHQSSHQLFANKTENDFT